jgi:type VI secretion system protein ImpJ
MNGYRPVYWSRGLFLHPQHFQAADAEMQRRTELLRLHGLPFFRGVGLLKWRGASIGHSLEIEQLEAIFPSGAAVNVPYDAAVAPLAVTADWPEPDKPGALYLGLALEDSAGNNAEPEGGAGGKRFVYTESPERLPDLYGSAPPAPVQRLRYAPVLIRDVDSEHYPNFELLPIALVRRAGEQVELDTRFTPPLFRLEASRRLTSLVQDVQDTALSCAGRLAGYKNTEGSESADMQFLINFTVLNILNRNIPLLSHLRSAPDIHPWHVYGALRVLLGELSTFYDDIDCLGRHSASDDTLPDYTHDNPGACFETLCAQLQQLLTGLGLSVSKTLDLLPAPPYFSAVVPDDFISPACRYWLMVRAAQLSGSETDNFPRYAKLGTSDRLNTIIAKAVSGVPLTKMRSAPPGFAKRADTTWYMVDSAHPLWQTIATQKKISLFWEGAPADAQVKLAAIGR